MTVEFHRIEACHVVHKPWGTETWLMPGNDVYPFALKELILKAGFVTSLQVHQFKSESIHLHIGHMAINKFKNINSERQCNDAAGNPILDVRLAGRVRSWLRRIL